MTRKLQEKILEIVKEAMDYHLEAKVDTTIWGPSAYLDGKEDVLEEVRKEIEKL